MNVSRSLVWLASLSLVGCASAPTPQGDPQEGGDGRVYRTVVHLNGTAPPTVHSEWISAEEAAAEVTAREARLAAEATTPATTATPPAAGNAQGTTGTSVAAITNDTGCGGADMWLQSATNQGGSRICFTGSGLANLDDYTLGTGIFAFTWSGLVRSYWGGSSTSAELRHYVGTPSDSNPPTCVEYSLAYRKQNTALACGQSANYLWLGSNFGYETFGRPTTVPPSDPNPADLYLDVNGLGRATPTAGLSLTLDGSTSYTLTTVADNPGGVRSVALDFSSSWSCTQGNVSQGSTGDFGHYETPTDNKTAGASTSTRNILIEHFGGLSNPCSPGWTYSGTTYTITATAKNYYGVTTTTQLATLHFTP